MKESFQNVFIGELTLDFADFEGARPGGDNHSPGDGVGLFFVFIRVCSHTCMVGGGGPRGEALRAESEPLTSVAYKVRYGISA